MHKNGEIQKSGTLRSAVLPTLFGAGVGLILLFLLIFLTAALILGGVLPAAKMQGPLMLCTFFSGFAGGIASIRSGNGKAMLRAFLTALILCAVFLVVSGMTGGLNSFNPFLGGEVLMLLSGGLLAGLLVRGEKKGKKAKK